MIKLYFDGNEIDKDFYRSLSQSYILFDKNFCLGSVPANTFKVELNNKSNVGRFSELNIKLDEENYAYVYYDSLDNSNNTKNIIHLSDKMVDFEFNYDASSLIKASESGYVTLLEILEDICSKKGVTLATKNFNLKDKQITWYDSTISARKYLSYIATLNGGFARINRNGELELVRYTNNIKSEINVNTCLDYRVGEYHKITKVVWDIGVEKWEYGVETGNTLYLDTTNPFITTKEDVESIYNLIKDFEFYSVQISKCPIDSNVNIGDTIALRIGDTLYPFIAQLELAYNGGFHGGYNFVVNTEKVEETSINETEKNIKSIKSRLNRDEAKLEIIAEETTEVKENLNNTNNKLNNNYYQKTQIEQLIINSSNGLTNTFSEAGGNNILRNTNFSAKEVLEEGQIYEYWYGNTIRQSSNSSANGYSILLQNNTLYQEQNLANGSYTFSFFYKKLNALANAFVKINEKQYELTEESNFKIFQTGVKDDNDAYIVEPITITDNHIKIEFITDINNSCEIYDIMLNAGKVKLAYSQNQNETITDTVNIGKGITIQTSTDDTKFVANNDKIGFKDSNNNYTTDFNSKGTNTNEIVVRNEATVVGILRQKVGDQIWDCMI